MLGTCRLVLAILVALSHVNFRIYGLNPGVIAVVCFYLISGYVMTGLIRQHFPTAAKIPSFYIDRALRLFPQYLAICGLTLAWYFTSEPQTAFLQHAPSALNLLENLTIVPLNYYMYNATDQFTLIPPAWSLGAEIQFYILLPWLIIFRKRWFALLAGIVMLGFASLGIINTDHFGYRLLPGVLVYFISGSLFYELKLNTIKQRAFAVACFLVIACVTIALHKSSHLQLPYNIETIIGFVCGILILLLTTNMKQRNWDIRLGNLSYGVFLNHFLLQWLVFDIPNTTIGLILYVLTSIFVAYLTQRFIERPVLSWRRNIRECP